MGNTTPVAAGTEFRPSFPPQQVRELPPDLRAVAVAIMNGQAAQPGSAARDFLTMVMRGNAGSQPPLTSLGLLRELPPDVRQMIMDSRAVSMAEFFKSWAESIARNAREDKKAHLCALRQHETLHRPEVLKRQLRHLTAGLQLAINLGKIPADQIPKIRAKIQEARELLGVAVSTEPPTPQARATSCKPPSAMPDEPKTPLLLYVRARSPL